MESPTTESDSLGDSKVSFLLDTDICSAFLKGDQRVWQKVTQHGGQLHVSTITVGELAAWVLRKGASVKRRRSLDDFLQNVVVLEVTAEIGWKFGELRAALLDEGLPTPDFDLFIASTALVSNLTLVTHNTRDYASIPGLRCQDWLI